MLHNKIVSSRPILGKVYHSYVNNQHISDLISYNEKMETYETIFSLLKDYNSSTTISEIKYRITEGEKINDVFIDVLSRDNILPLCITTYLIILNEFESMEFLENFL